MLPPESTTTVVPAAGGVTLPSINAAAPTAPAPSTTSLDRMSNITIASAISFSPTATISSTCRLMRSTVMPVGRFTAIPSARVGPPATVAGTPASGPARKGAQNVRLHSDDLDGGAERVDGTGDPGREPTTAEGHDHHGEVVHVLNQLEPECPLARHDRPVVERMHEMKARLPGVGLREEDAVVERLALEMHRRAVADGRVRLRDRGLRRHEDLARNTRRARRVNATACAWLPAEATTTPGHAPSPSAASFADAPRILNDPVRWRFSALRTTREPVSSAQDPAVVDRCANRNALHGGVGGLDLLEE